VIQVKEHNGHLIIAENEVPFVTENMESKSATILIVDDEEACLTSLELLLHGTNYKLIKACGGHEALDYLKANPNSIDLIMLDLMIPNMYGLNVLSELKSDPMLAKIPVILQSGTSDEREIDKAYKMGIISYVAKPYEKKIILELLLEIL
jgi:two-component system sensor histidine kinase ChiS